MRLAEPTDCSRLEYLEYLLFPKDGFNEFTLKGELTIGRCWVVERRNKIVAYLLARVDGELIDIMRVGVMPEFQGKGIGTQLVRMAMTQAPTAMLCVRKENKGALQLYRRLGFHIQGEVTAPDVISWVMTTSRESRSCARSGTPS
jgi:ribosomal-protein-alanine N-acetyltransferase